MGVGLLSKNGRSERGRYAPLSPPRCVRKLDGWTTDVAHPDEKSGAHAWLELRNREENRCIDIDTYFGTTSPTQCNVESYNIGDTSRTRAIP